MVSHVSLLYSCNRRVPNENGVDYYYAVTFAEVQCTLCHTSYHLKLCENMTAYVSSTLHPPLPNTHNALQVSVLVAFFLLGATTIIYCIRSFIYFRRFRASHVSSEQVVLTSKDQLEESSTRAV